MSLTEPLNNVDTSAQDEDGLKRTITAIVVALVVFAVAAFLYLYLGRAKPASAGAIVRVNTYQMPVATKTDEGADLPQTVAQQFLVLVQMHVENKTDKTLTIQDIYGDLNLPSGIRRSTAANGRDFYLVFTQFPATAPLKADPLLPDTKIGPHQSVDGLVILDYPIQAADYNLRKGLTMNVDFDNNTRLTLQAP